METAGAAAGVMLLPTLMTIGIFAVWILAIIALWRGMKAHESIAESMRRIAQNQRQT